MKSNILILKLEKDMTEKLSIQWQEGYISEKKYVCADFRSGVFKNIERKEFV